MTDETLYVTKTMADVYAGQGYLEKAAGMYRILLDREPGRTDIREALARVEAGLDSAGGESLDRLRPLIGRYVDLLFVANRLKRLESVRSRLVAAGSGKEGKVG